MAEQQEEDILEAIAFPQLDSLPPHFLAFLRDNQVPPDAYNLPMIYRFLRVSEKLCKDMELKEIALKFQEEVNELANSEAMGEKKETIRIEPLDWFSSVGHRFLRLEASHRVAGTQMYSSGMLYGIDISSAAAVVALGVLPGEQVLDFCCAPGAKMAMISDTLINEEEKLNSTEEMSSPRWKGSVSGVDISSERLASCRNLCKKYSLANVRLFLDDATQFSVLAPPPHRDGSVPTNPKIEAFPLPVFPPDLQIESPKVLTNVPALPKKTAKALKKRNKNKMPTLFFASDFSIVLVASERYDKILVDAPCTLDASIRHLLKYNKVGWIDFDANPSAAISTLQKKMLFNAFRLLKTGGSLIYSTCSFCTAQNEDVVRWLVNSHSNASVVPITWPSSFSLNIDPGHLTHTVRFYPKNSGTSGMFIAKIVKIAPQSHFPPITASSSS
jgi:16S rRNA C967 or C1407 C5-methylase (RsmB/RsmF family)